MECELHRVPTEDLAAELERRSKTLYREPTPIPHCDECGRFVPYAPQSEKDTPPPKYNPCSKGRVMRFRVPQNYGDVNDGNWGFYLRGCTDRLPTT